MKKLIITNDMNIYTIKHFLDKLSNEINLETDNKIVYSYTTRGCSCMPNRFRIYTVQCKINKQNALYNTIHVYILDRHMRSTLMRNSTFKWWPEDWITVTQNHDIWAYNFHIPKEFENV